MTEKQCKIDVEGHPVDGWRIIAKGDTAICNAKLKELLKHSGPYNQKFVKRRWAQVEEST
ncbi:MAG: hypothetical protein ACXABY_21970 [Candidatus Thorarchaeota archaeon]